MFSQSGSLVQTDIRRLSRESRRRLICSTVTTTIWLLQGAKSVNLLLTDVVMPGKNGRKLAEEAVKLSPSLKILYMTGYSRNAILHQGRLDADVELIQSL
jgi:two-component SAPR family response regulator